MPLPLVAVGVVKGVKAANTAYKVGKWASLISMVICILLIIFSLLNFTVWNNTTSGWILLILGAPGLYISYRLYTKFSRGLLGDIIYQTKSGISAISSMVSEKSGAYEEFDKEINELDFLETEEEAQSKLPRKEKKEEKEKNEKKERKDNIVHRKKHGAAEMQGALKSFVETLNEEGELADVHESMLQNPNESVEDMLKRLHDNKEKVSEVYKKLDSRRKQEADESLDVLEDDAYELKALL